MRLISKENLMFPLFSLIGFGINPLPTFAILLFIGKLIKQITAGQKELNIVNDKDGTPTYTRDFAKTVKELIQTDFFGLYNLVCSGNTSRIEVAKHLLAVLEINDVHITEVDSSFFESEYFAKRPPSENLLNKKLELRGVNKMTDWKTALESYINVYFSHLKDAN